MDQGVVTSSRSWRPGLDGLRAIAVLAVLAYHEPEIAMAGGFLGVDLFFVLSGFLITGLLLDEHETHGRISLRGFWTRRSRRLLPALALLLAVVTLVTIIEHDVQRLINLPAEVLAAGFYVSNWQQILDGDSYFTQFDALSPLRHLWSLAVEEQFYLVWPLVVVACLRRSLRLLVVVTVIAAIASAVWMAVLLDPSDPTRVYFGTDTRVFEVLIGAVTAMGLWKRSPVGRMAGALGGICLVAVIVAMVFIPDTEMIMYRGGMFAFAVIAAIAVAVAAGEGVLARVTGHPVLRRIGMISYALYLWHWPVRVYLTDDRLPWTDSTLGTVADVLTRLAVTVALSVLSTVLVENRLRHRDLGLRTVTLGWASVTTVTFVALLVVSPSDGERITFGDSGAHTAESLDELATSGDSSRTGTEAQTTGAATLQSDRPPRVMIVGDSVAITLGEGVARMVPPGVEVINGGVFGCAFLQSPRVMTPSGEWGPSGTGCPDHVEQWRAMVTAQRPDLVLVLTGVWDLYARDWGEGPLVPGDRLFDDRYRRAVRNALGAVSATGTEVMLMSTPCFGQHPDLPPRAEFEPTRTGRLAQIQREVVAELRSQPLPGSVSVLELRSVTCENDEFVDAFGGVRWRPDGVHFSADGADRATQWMFAALPTSIRVRLGV